MIGVVALQIGVAFAVIVAGWLAARRDLLDDAAARRLSRLVVDVTFPAMAFAQVLRSTDAAVLAREWYVPVVGAALLVVAALVGFACSLAEPDPTRRRTAAFLIATPNWIYLPLPIATGLLGETGTRLVLLINVGAQFVLWTLGVWMLERRLDLRASLRAVARNAGLWATVAAVAVACVPGVRGLATMSGAGVGGDAMSIARVAGAVILQALAVIGTLTVPLALLVTGVQLRAMRSGSGGERIGRALVVTMVGRLIAAPVVTAVVLVLLRGVLAPDVRRVVALVAAMPAAITCGMFVERFGGNARLAAVGVLVTTVVSLATVPVVMAWGG